MNAPYAPNRIFDDYAPERIKDERPNLVDLLAAEWVQREAPRQSPFHRAISGDCFFLITGAMVALDLCLVIWLSQR